MFVYTYCILLPFSWRNKRW